MTTRQLLRSVAVTSQRKHRDSHGFDWNILSISTYDGRFQQVAFPVERPQEFKKIPFVNSASRSEINRQIEAIHELPYEEVFI